MPRGGGGLSKATLFCINTYKPKLEIIEGLVEKKKKNQKTLCGSIALFWNIIFDSFLTLTGKVVIYYKKYQMRIQIWQVSLTSLYSGLSVFFLMVVLLLDFLCTSGLR